jgi:hypothetical protein
MRFARQLQKLPKNFFCQGEGRQFESGRPLVGNPLVTGGFLFLPPGTIPILPIIAHHLPITFLLTTRRWDWSAESVEEAQNVTPLTMCDGKMSDDQRTESAYQGHQFIDRRLGGIPEWR